MSARKKRKTKKAQVQVPFPVLIANIVIVVMVLGLSYMWLCARCDSLGKEIKRKESQLTASAKRLANEQDKWSLLTSPGNLERTIRAHRLMMIMPQEKQIVRVSYRKDSDKAKLAYR